MFIADRDLEVYVMRKNGATYECIGKTYGISKERVRQICRRIDREKRKTKDEARIIDDLYELTFGCRQGFETRIYNGLRRAGITTIDEFLSLKPGDILNMRGLGAKSMTIILQLQDEYNNKDKQ